MSTFGTEKCGLPETRIAPFSALDVFRVQCYQEDQRYDSYQCDHGHELTTMQMTHDGLRCPVCEIVQGWVLDSTFRLMKASAEEFAEAWPSPQKLLGKGCENAY